MSLSLLTPAALALGLLALGPVLAHMTRQRPSQEQAFGAMLLIRRMKKRLERKRRIRDRLLLLLRVLAVLLAALAVAGPRLSWPGDAPEFGGTGLVVVVLDDSLSMALQDGGGALFDEAREEAADLVEGLPEGTLVGLVRVGGSATRVTPTLTAEHGRVLSGIEATQVGYGRTDLAGALREARALLGGQPGEVVVFTDQAGPGVISGSSTELERLIDLGSAVIPRVVEADPPRNVSVAEAVYGDGLEGGSVRVRLANFGPEPIEQAVTVSLPDGSEINAFVEIPAEGVAEESFTVPRSVPGGVASVRVHDTGLVLDDTRWFHLPRVGASKVMVVDGDPGPTPFKSEVFFLERALSPWGAQRSGVLPEIVSPAGLRELDAEEHRVVFLANVADPGPYAGQLIDFVRQGGGLVIAMGGNVTPRRYNGPLQELLPTGLRERTNLVAFEAAEGVRLRLPDAEHALFAPFTHAGRSSFGRVQAFQAMTVEPYEERSGTDPEDPRPATLLSWSDGNPALIEHQVGQGRVLLWTTTLDKDWTNTPLEGVYMPFVQRIVGWLGGEAGGGALRAEARVGERVELTLPLAELEPQVRGPGGEVRAELIRGEELTLRFTADEPGGYSVGVEGEPPMAWVAVNTDAEESDVRVRETLAEAEAAISPELLVNRAELGPSMAGLAGALLLLQALLAMSWARPEESDDATA